MTADKTITLSFDNGPHADGTPQVLDLLAARRLKAWFFLVAQRLQDPALRALAQRTKDAGHAIGNHTLTHTIALGRRPGAAVAQAEIGAAQDQLAGLASARMFRPNGDKGQKGPHLLSSDAVHYLQEHRYTAVHWNCVPRDWELPADGWVGRAEAAIASQDWTLLVLHDHCTAALPHLGPFLDRLIDSGATFTQAMPADCVMVRDGQAMPALAGMFTTSPA